MSGRLNGTTGYRELQEGLFVHTHASMSEAVGLAISGAADYANQKNLPRDRAKRVAIVAVREQHRQAIAAAAKEAMNGNANLPRLVEQADALIDAAILEDPRLNRKHAWVRAEEGVDADPALVCAGEPACCIDRRRIRLRDADTTLEPVRIVISTDSTDDASDEHVVAFIAAAKLAQQFRPLEIWWQGAWLDDDNESKGTVLLAPLIQGDLDFARVQFFLSHKLRDKLSYRCGWYHWATVPSGGSFKVTRVMQSFGGARATYSHLPDTFDFITEKGIPSAPWEIARLAARWAGLESLWRTEINGGEAEQYWRPESNTPSTSTETPAQKAERDRRWKEQEQERERQRKEEAKQRTQQTAS